jgi:hypothetical protein
MDALSAEDKVVLVQPNYKYYLADYPNDPEYQDGKQDYLRADPLLDADNAGSINAAGAWQQLGNTSLSDDEKVLVAVIDSGAKRSHADLQGCIIKDKCVTYDNGRKMDFQAIDDSDDDSGHGTKVTGIIGADIDNGIGVVGIAGGRAKIFAVDVCDIDKSPKSINIVMGIYYATDQGAKVINISLGGHYRDLMVERAIKYAWDHGTICICSAGNEGSSSLNTPSDTPYAVSVMAHEWNGDPTSFTCYGIESDISAPGNNIYTTGYLRNTSYETFNGTSSSAPVVTGAVALLLSADPDLTPREIKNLLYTSSGKESFSAEKSGQGFGRINLDTAMKNLLSEERTTPEKIVINKKSINMYEGADTSIEYAVYPGNTDTVDVTFTSSNENIVSVDDEGILTAKAPGKADIRITCKGASAVCKVTVRETPYITIDRKPFFTTGTITMDELMDSIVNLDEEGNILQDSGVLYHQYRIDLEKGETINAVMDSSNCDAYLQIKDKYDSLVASDDNDKTSDFSTVCYTAEETGTYKIEAMQYRYKGKDVNIDYLLKISSDRSFCSPKVTSTDYGQMRMTWPAVEHADCYLVRKYEDKKLTKVIKEEFVDALKYTDTSYDKNKVQYYSVTACVQTAAGTFYNGESPVVVKMNNPVTVKGRTIKAKAKTLKKKSLTFAKPKVLTVRKAKGTVTYTKASGNKKITINRKTGKVKIRKNLKKGTYKVKVKVRVAGNASYKAGTRTVTFRAKVQ